MNSIDKNQKEKNHQDLFGADSVQKITELAKDQTCFLCTNLDGKETTRPMSVQKVDEEGAIWFLSPNDSNQNKQIMLDESVKLYFQGSSHSDFMYLSGYASISEDKNIIKELWNPILKTWFTEGENDPRISVIKVVPTEGYYWDNKHGNFIAGVKIMLGAATGKTFDDSIQGELKN